MLGHNRVVYPVKTKPKRPVSRRLVFSALFFLGLAAIVGGTVYILNLPALNANKIYVHGAMLISAADVEKEVKDELSGKLWRFMPKSNFFLISSQRIKSNLENKFSSAAEINVEKVFPSSLNVTLKEHLLWGVYCEQNYAGVEAESCFYIDGRGVAYEDISEFRGALLPVVYSAKQVKVGDEVITPSVIQFFEEAKKSSVEVRANLLSLTLSTSTPSDVRLNFSEGWYAIVNMSQSAGEWLDVLKTVLDKDIGDKRNQLEYIDLRFGNKVFYKYKQ